MSDDGTPGESYDIDGAGTYSVDDEDQLQSEDTLVDRGVDDILDEGYSPPERPRAVEGFGTTAAEVAQGETLDMRVAQEEPDEDVDSDLIATDAGIDAGAASAEEAAMHVVDDQY